jgi:hypothetical protein
MIYTLLLTSFSDIPRPVLIFFIIFTVLFISVSYFLFFRICRYIGSFGKENYKNKNKNNSDSD